MFKTLEIIVEIRDLCSKQISLKWYCEHFQNVLKSKNIRNIKFIKKKIQFLLLILFYYILLN